MNPNTIDASEHGLAKGPRGVNTLRILSALMVYALCSCGPLPIGGAGQGETCSRNVDCETGLACECEVCVEERIATEPPSCDVEIETECGDEPSYCYAACGEEVVIGLAECVNAAENCEESGGVLRDDCPDTTCWGEPEPGEVCVNGEYQCQAGEAPNGECYTFDCPSGEAELCVLSCTDESPFSQVCIGSQWQCETGFPVRQCGGCVGMPPTCYDNCENLDELFGAICVDDEWTCDGVLVDVGVLLEDCGFTDAGVSDGGPDTPIGEIGEENGPCFSNNTCFGDLICVDSGQTGWTCVAPTLTDGGVVDGGQSDDSGQSDDGGESDDGGPSNDGGSDGGGPLADAGHADSGAPETDAGGFDAGLDSPDGGEADAGETDAGEIDAGDTDSAVNDAGTEQSSSDAGVVADDGGSDGGS